MPINLNCGDIPKGWKGGFAQSNKAFAYPEPDLSSLPMLGNMDNINRITRQMHVFWPEFSWQIEKGNEKSRCFQLFAEDISSIGYDNTGRIWSIICPQQGACFNVPRIGIVGGGEICLNVEVTVTGQRGWVDEEAKGPKGEKEALLAADMTVEGKIWFSSDSHKK